MPMAAAVSGLVGGAAANICTPIKTGVNWDARGFFSGLFLEGRGNTVSQQFERRFANIDYKVQRQALHREDIRDLVDLTASRMDIYNLVGTLLLTFCITWFTDNSIMESELPAWFADLFLISNFAAVGFLVISVWLAMFASVASKSIGCRLLTSFNRLSLPVEEEVQNISIPIFFPTDKVLRWARGLLPGRSEKHGESKATQAQRKEPSWLSSAAPSRPGGQAFVEGSGKGSISSSDDDQQHFRRFMHELPRWLNHDTYSRVCMSLGMNQMLQALSYNILGFIWKKSPLSASLCFLAVKLLSVIIMKLDFSQRGDRRGGRLDQMALVFLHAAPPFLAAIVLWCPLLYANHIIDLDTLDGHWSLIASVSFFLHAGWLWYVARSLNTVLLKTGTFRPGYYANVLEWVDNKAIRRDLLCHADSFWHQLYRAMDERVQEELKAGTVTVEGRQNAYTQGLCRDLTEACAELFNLYKHTHPAIDRKLMCVERTLKQFVVWAKAPEVLAHLEALRSPEVQGKMTGEEKKVIERAYRAFLLKCQELRIGIVYDQPGPPVALRMGDEDKLAVRLDTFYETSNLPKYVWFDTRSEELLTGEPTGVVTTNYSDVVATLLPQWRSNTDSLHGPAVPPESVFRELDTEDNAIDNDVRETVERVSADPTQVDGGPMPGRWMASKRLELTHPPENIPYKMVWLFTVSTMWWWLVAGSSRAVLGLMGRERILEFQDERPWPYRRLSWLKSAVPNLTLPEPGSLVQLHALHCAGPELWLSSKYATYGAARLPGGGLGPFEELGDNAVATAICGAQGCHALRPPAAGEAGGPWLLQTSRGRAPGGEGAEEPVPIPRSWRLVAGAWRDCEDAVGSDCTATLVGWDGTGLVGATMRRADSGRSWAVRPRFELDPRLAFCAGSASSRCSRAPGPRYDDVRALQLGAGARELTVLVGGGVLHVWDLARGGVLARLGAGDDYTSMCQGGGRIFLARPGLTGPHLDVAELPHAAGLLPQPAAPAVFTAPPASDAGAVGDRRERLLARRLEAVVELADLDEKLARRR